MKQYDIFISYRRSSYDTANLIATRLKSAGYSVFFDMEALRSGKFNEQLFGVIDNCKDFLVVLPPNALERCVNEDDWVRLEVCRAMANKKNIVPVMLNGFTWPNPMPIGMEELCDYQALTATSTEYFDMAMERLQQRYLKSKSHLFLRRWMKYLLAVVVSLLTILSIVWGVLFYISIDVCTKYATCLTKDASAVHMIAEQNDRLQRDWNVFRTAIVREHDEEKVAHLQQDMLMTVDFIEKNIVQSWTVDSADLKISDYHGFLLSLHGINADEIKLSPSFATMYYSDYIANDLERIRIAVKEPNTLNLRAADTFLEIFTHSKNSFYASILSELSNFPKKSLGTFNELNKLWIHFPKEFLMGGNRTYYEDIINSESKKIELLLSEYESVLNEEDARMEDMQRQTDKMEHEINKYYDDISKKIDSTTSVIKAAQAIDAYEKDLQYELALRREKMNTKQVEVKASRAELEELDKQYIKTYESLKKKCTIEESDDQWYMWGKICRWGQYLNIITESRKQLDAQGVRSTSSITPDIVYAEMNSLLTVYQTYHPESKEYVASAKTFYRELSKGNRPYAGILIFGFKDNATHPVLKAGDIVVGYNGKSVKNYNDLKAAFKQSENGKVQFIRLVDGEFIDKEYQWEETGIVGFIELTE